MEGRKRMGEENICVPGQVLGVRPGQEWSEMMPVIGLVGDWRKDSRSHEDRKSTCLWHDSAEGRKERTNEGRNKQTYISEPQIIPL